MAKHNLALTYIGGPTAWIEFGGLHLLTDPTFDPAGGDYATGPVTLSKTMGPSLEAGGLGFIDAALLSHDHHFDNLDHAGRALLPHAGQVLTTEAGAERLGGNAIGLAPWKSVEITAPDRSVLKVTATPARHGPEGGDHGPVIGFVLEFTDDPGNAVYISGDTVWYEGVEEVFQRFPIGTAVLFMGAARVRLAGPAHLTFTAEEGVKIAQVLPKATIVPLHFEGWKHFSESKTDIEKAFEDAGIADRLRWPEPGKALMLSRK
jgi:L-ascorbate metabolism protein UlaG (beta-lactamase superfamily)